MRNLYETSKDIKSKEDFIKFIEALVQDLRSGSANWENSSLSNYLEAMQSWTEDMDGYYINQKLPVPENVSWKVFADILMAARIYE